MIGDLWRMDDRRMLTCVTYSLGWLNSGFMPSIFDSPFGIDCLVLDSVIYLNPLSSMIFSSHSYSIVTNIEKLLFEDINFVSCCDHPVGICKMLWNVSFDGYLCCLNASKWSSNSDIITCRLSPSYQRHPQSLFGANLGVGNFAKYVLP